MNSRIYTGFVEHTRTLPKEHRFRYPVYTFAFDLDELTELDRALPLFGYNRLRPVSLYDRDYLDEAPGTIRAKLLRFLADQGLAAGVARIMLVTSARYFHYIFNPVNFYYCFDAKGELLCNVAEVNNTFGDRHLYILDAPESASEGWLRRYRARKEFHVSPFNNLEGEYEFLFSPLEPDLDIRIRLHREGELVFHAQLAGEARPLTAGHHWRTLLRHPAVPHLTVPRILWQAARLCFGKKMTVYDHPGPVSAMTILRRGPGWFERRARQQIERLLGRIEVGQLRLISPEGTERVCGDAAAEPRVELRIRDRRFYARLALGGHVAVGETYVDGDWEASDLTALLRLLIDNRDRLDDGNLLTASLTRAAGIVRHLRRRNDRDGSKKNIAAHYDLSNDFYRLWLDAGMNYSCAIYRAPGETLEEAQRHKLHALIDKAGIGPDDHVLEIGCGWGGFAVAAVERTGCRVTGLTLSQAQYDYARERVRRAGLEERIAIELRDYRDVRGQFDRIVSIEMLEAVGHKYLGAYFAACDRLLKPGGRAVIQVITVPDQRYDAYRRNPDWIQQHIFPGGICPSLTALCRAMARDSTLVVQDVENIGIHYARTLTEWRARFLARWDEIAPLGFDERFRRKWLYYLAYCEAGFATRTLGDLILVLARAGEAPADNRGD